MAFTADYPGAIVVEARNYGYTANGQPIYNRPRSWCLHTPEEPADNVPSTPYFFRDTLIPASTHYFVSWLGFVFQMVPEEHGAYANGVQGKPYPSWADPAINLNLQTLSIEIEGYAATIHQTMKRGGPQWKALIELLAHRCIEFGMNPHDMIGHYQVSNQRSDPGTLNMGQVIVDVIVKIAEITKEEEDMADFTNEQKDYLGGLMRGNVQALGNGVMNSPMRANDPDWVPPVTLKDVIAAIVALSAKIDAIEVDLPTDGSHDHT